MEAGFIGAPGNTAVPKGPTRAEGSFAFRLASPKMSSYANTVAAKAVGAVKNTPIPHTSKPAKFINRRRRKKPKALNQGLVTILRLSSIADQKSSRFSITRIDTNIHATAR